MNQDKGRLELQILEEEELTSSPKYGEADGQVDDWLVDDAPQSDYRGPNAGSTACVAVVRNARVVVANAGDSRCVISRNCKAYDLSKEHKPVLEEEKKRIICAGGYIQCGRVNAKLHVSRAIGSMELKKDASLPAEEQIHTAIPDIKIIDLNDDDDFFVIAS